MSFTPIEFAVIVFILKKIQQGASLPKHLPLPLRGLLPKKVVAAPAKKMWDLNEKKIEEIGALWDSVAKGKDKIGVKSAKTELSQICKNPSICRQM